MFKTKTITVNDTEFKARIYEPKNPVASILVLHGMSEHKRRYHEMMTYFKDNNIYGVIYDHRGHGARKKTKSGHFESFKDLVLDAHTVFKELPDYLPKFVLGHSMGSIVLRVLLKDINPDGAILVGTGTRNSNLDKIGGKLINQVSKMLPDRKLAIINKLGFIGYDEHFKGNVPNRWLSSNYANVYQYNKDPMSGHMMSNNAFRETNNALVQVDDIEFIRQYPTSTKYLFLSGKEDAFGHYGKDIEILKDKYTAVDLDAEAILYEGYRHELLNEGARFDIFDTIIEWMIDNEK